MWHTQYADIIYIYMCVCVCDIYIYIHESMDALRTACRSHLVMKNIDKCIENATQSAVCCIRAMSRDQAPSHHLQDHAYWSSRTPPTCPLETMQCS